MLYCFYVFDNCPVKPFYGLIGQNKQENRMSNNERFWVGFLCLWRAFLATMFLLIGLGFMGGCGGGDDGNCGMTDGCGLDAGTATNPDTGTTPDAPNVCAEYEWMKAKLWDCHRDDIGRRFICAMDPRVIHYSSNTGGGVRCDIYCQDQSEDRVWFEAATDDPDVKIHMAPPPAAITAYSGHPEEVVCTQRP